MARLKGLEKLDAYLSGLVGVRCTMPFERVEELAGHGLPPEAASMAWWPESLGGAGDGAAVWRVETVWAEKRQVRFVRAT